MSWSECFKLRAVADHYRSIVLGLSCPLALLDAGPHLFEQFAVTLAVCGLSPQPGGAIEQLPTQSKPTVFFHAQLFPDVFSHPIFKTRVRRSLLWSAGNLKGGLQ
jgi:hypothetical protein